MKLLVLAAFWMLVAVCALWFVAHKGRVPVDPGDMDRTPGDW